MGSSSSGLQEASEHELIFFYEGGMPTFNPMSVPPRRSCGGKVLKHPILKYVMFRVLGQTLEGFVEK